MSKDTSSKKVHFGTNTTHLIPVVDGDKEARASVPHSSDPRVISDAEVAQVNSRSDVADNTKHNMGDYTRKERNHHVSNIITALTNGGAKVAPTKTIVKTPLISRASRVHGDHTP